MKTAVTSFGNPGRSSAEACFTDPSFPVASPPPQQLLPCSVLTVEGKGLYVNYICSFWQPVGTTPKASRGIL